MTRVLGKYNTVTLACLLDTVTSHNKQNVPIIRNNDLIYAQKLVNFLGQNALFMSLLELKTTLTSHLHGTVWLRHLLTQVPGDSLTSSAFTQVINQFQSYLFKIVTSSVCENFAQALKFTS